MRRAIPILALAALPFTPLAVEAKGLNGCPDGQFTLDTCVICLPGYEHKQTGATGDGGKPCYECAKVSRAAQEAPRCANPIVMPAGVAGDAEIFGPAGGN